LHILAAKDSVFGNIEDEFRLRDRYIIHRDETGRRLTYILEPPLILHWVNSLVSAA
jgi:hypothetical protein